MRKPANRPTVPEVVKLITALHAREGGAVGCCCHIMTDDPNWDQASADFCLQWAREQGHADCIELAEKMAQMTTTQRRKASRCAR